MLPISTQTKDQLLEYRNLFRKTGNIHPNVRPVVAESWLRCKKYDVQELRRTTPLSNSQLEKLLKKNAILCEAAYPIMSTLVEMIMGTRYIMTLHDREGYILSALVAGDDMVLPPDTIGKGIRWAEETIGTCTPALCLRTDQEIQLFGGEHYAEYVTDILGTAAPVHDSNGEVVGCFNMCGHFADYNPHTLGIVKSTAIAIERQMTLNRTMMICQTAFDAMPDGAIIIDAQYHVRQINQQAVDILRTTRNALCGIDFRTVMQETDFSARLKKERLPFQYPECMLQAGRTSISCNVIATPFILEEKYAGCIITLRKSKTLHRLANQVMGNQARYSFEDIITVDPEMKAQIEMMKEIADTDCCVLIEGESGTGKELFAHALHRESLYRDGPFVAVNCASLPRSLVESELFGYEKGAFTGAKNEGNPGKFELADGGTIFLDEIGELPLEIQATLLRVLDNHRITRIGGRTEKELNVRIVAATNRNLYQEIQNGNFRADLYFRLNIMKFDIPPLRKRRGDVPLLANVFLERMNTKTPGRLRVFSEDFLETLSDYQWPGNVRELQNIVICTYYACKEKEISLATAPFHVVRALASNTAKPAPEKPEAPPDLSMLQQDPEYKAIENALRQCEGNVEKAGELLDISKATLYRRIKKYGISTKQIAKDLHP